MIFLSCGSPHRGKRWWRYGCLYFTVDGEHFAFAEPVQYLHARLYVGGRRRFEIPGVNIRNSAVRCPPLEASSYAGAAAVDVFRALQAAA